MRLLLVDDHEVVRRGVRSLLLENINSEFCDEAVDGEDALAKVDEFKPDLIVMDVSMPRLNGLEATRRIVSKNAGCKVIILSQHESREMARQALQAGARGYVVKSAIAKDLIAAVQRVSAGELFFDPAIVEHHAPTTIDVQEILQRSAAFEQALRDSEELYRSTFELTAVGIAHVSPEGKWLRVNKKLCEIVGYSEAELLRLTFQDITHPDDLAADVQQAEKVRTGELQTYSMEKRYLRKDHTLVWINLTVSGVRDKDGSLKHFISVVEDISERKTVQEALQESQAQLALALESSRTALFDWDLIEQRGKWNSQMAKLYEFTPSGEYITAEEWRSLFHPDDVTRLAEEAERIWRGKDQQFTFEFRTVRVSGEVRWMLSHGRIIRDGNGKAVRMIGTHTDITDRKRADEDLQQRQAELNEAQRLAKIGSWHWSPATDTVLWSDELYRIAGRDPKLGAVSYQDHHTLYTPESWDRLQVAVNEALKNGTPYSIELELIRGDGQKIWIVANGEAQRDSAGLVTALRGTVQDITERKRMEDELRETEERTLFSLEAANIGTWEWDIATGQVRWSRNMESVHGQEPGSFGASFESFLEGVFVEDRDKVKQQIKLALSGKGTYHVEYRPHRSSGTLGWMEAHGRVIFDAQGKPLRMFGICADVTDRRNAQDATGLLAAIVASSDDAIVSKTLAGVITSWNAGAQKIFGYTAAEAVGQHITLIIPPDRISEEANILLRLSRGEKIDHFETIRQRKDGTLIEVSVTISPLRDSEGRIIGASKVARDITAQKRAAQALRESEQRLRAITDATPIMVWMSGTDKNCYYFNKGWLDFVGRSLEEEVGNGWADAVHPDDLDRCMQIYVSNFDARRPFKMEYRLRHHTGRYRWILDCGVPRFTADGTFEGYVGGCLDIQDQKDAAEKIRIADDTMRLMRVQDEERRRIARELHDSAGQTLTVLGLSLAQLTERAESIAPELAKAGKEIEEIVQQLHREIRTTSYLLHPPLLDEAGLKSALSWYVEGVAERSGIAIDLSISDDFGRLPGDMELAVFRVVQECLTNIHRHAASKTAFIRVARDDGSVYIEVRDEGKGISPERLAEIQSRGSGVGIAGIRERLRQFGGEMNIDSTDSGTRVVSRIPLPRDAAPTEMEPFQAAV